MIAPRASFDCRAESSPTRLGKYSRRLSSRRISFAAVAHAAGRRRIFIAPPSATENGFLLVREPIEYLPSLDGQFSATSSRHLDPKRGALAIVTTLGRDAMDATARVDRPLSVACPHGDEKKPPPGRSGDGFFLARDPRNKPLPPRPNAIDAAICIAASVMTDRSARHRTRPEHDACPGNATGRIFNVLAVHDRLGWRRIESETCKPQQGASSNPGNCR